MRYCARLAALLVAAPLAVSGCSTHEPGSLCDAKTEAAAHAIPGSPLFTVARKVASASPSDVTPNCLDDDSGDANTGAAFSFEDSRDFEAVSAKFVRALGAQPLEGLRVNPGKKTFDPGDEEHSTPYQDLGRWVFRAKTFAVTLSAEFNADPVTYTFAVSRRLEPQ